MLEPLPPPPAAATPAIPMQALTTDEKKARQRQHVRRSYYRKLDKMRGMRERMAELKGQYMQALDGQETLLLAGGNPWSALERYVKVARAKEALLEENAALRELLEAHVAVAYRSDQLMLELSDDAGSPDPHHPLAELQARKRSDDKRFSVVEPVTAAECQRVSDKTYTEIREFLQSDSLLTSGTSNFEWRDRRKIDGDRLKFSLQKSFVGASALALSQRSWEIVADPAEHRSLHSASLHARLFRAQRVNDNNVVMYRVFVSDDGQYAAKSLFLVSRFAVGRVFVVLLRSIDRDRLRQNRRGHDELFDDDAPPEVLLENEQWLDVFSWLIFEQEENACKLDFGGDVRSTGVASSTLWVLEVLLIALRWETKVIGPLVPLTAH
ncbi:hypothetical protein PybrP1_001915 [[Pythium] brassicae (nom. inval.)]|nr:hypothetical protein PybrP1_001915 [[Pythium] brassicae (nom. inval.)]